MNWLAHVFLSPPDADFRLGNLLADVVRGPSRELMTPAFREGVACHLRIDSYTDSHAVVRRSKDRISAPRRRYAGILVDIFYDHFLAVHWPRIAGGELNAFTTEFYAEARGSKLNLPEDALLLIRHMILSDRLGSYVKITGIENALSRLAARWATRFHRAAPLHDATEELRLHYHGLEADFLEFFPQLVDHISESSARTVVEFWKEHDAGKTP